MKDWQELQEKESAEGVPVGAPVFRYRSIQADCSREMLEIVGNLRTGGARHPWRDVTGSTMTCVS
jgi:hypothetical protein